jgi:uncharacterized protein involved in exopolysaccharide biosynthesis
MSSENTGSASLESSNIIVLLYRWRKTIILVVLAAAIISAGASYLIQPKYKSTVTMFASPSYSVGAQLYESSDNDLAELGDEEDSEKLLQLLNSDELRTMIVDKYDLWTVYDIPRDAPGAKTYIALEYADNVESKMTRFGSVTVSVLDTDPERAKNIANDIAILADTINVQMRRDRSLKAVQIAEESIADMEHEVQTVNDSLQKLQQKGIYSYHNQIAALTEMYGRAVAMGFPERAAKLKADMDYLSSYGAQYSDLEERLVNTHTKLAHLKKRSDLIKADSRSTLPVKYIVDFAQIADKKAYPIRWLIVAMSTVSAFVFVVAFILIWETFAKFKREGLI